MKKMKVYILAVGLLLSGVTAAGLAQQADKTPKDIGDKLQQMGNQQADPKTAGEAREALSQLINDATTAGKFPALVADLCKQDRQRIGDMPRENYEALNAAIAQFRRDFQDRYHQEFTFRPSFLKDAEVNLGATRNAVSVSLAASSTAAAAPVPPAAAKPMAAGAVSGPAISLLDEGNGQAAAWKADIPNEISGKELKATLTKHLQKLEEQKAAWPENADAAYRAAAAEILQAMTDTSLAVDQ